MSHQVHYIYKIILLVLIAISVVSCGGGGGSTLPPPAVDSTPPLIVATAPSSEQVGVQTNVAIKVIFNETIADADISNVAIYPFVGNVAQLSQPVILASSPFQFNSSTKTLTIRLQQGEIKPATIYQVRMNDITDSAGNPMKNRCEWIFATEGTSAPNTIGVGNTNVCGTAPNNNVVPGQAQGISAVASNSFVTLSWLAPSTGGKPLYYKIDKSIENQQTFTEVNANFSADSLLSLTDSNVQNGTPYIYRIIAVNAIGEGSAAFSSVVSPGSTAVQIPGVPQNAIAVAGNGEVTVNWQAPITGGSPSYYQIQKTVAGVLSQTVVDVTVLSYTDNLAINGKNHIYHIMAVNSAGTSPIANTPAVIPQRIIGVPGTPLNVSATAGDTQVTVTWTAPNTIDAASYYIVEKSISGGAFTSVNPNTTALVIIDNNALNDVSHVYKITAANSAGIGGSSLSNSVIPVAAAPQVVRSTMDLTSPSPGVNQNFAISADYSPDGNTLVVGESYGDPANNRGRVHFFTKAGVNWNRGNSLTSSTVNDRFGEVVDFSPNGTYLAIANVEKVQIYTKPTGNWTLSQSLTSSIPGTSFGYTFDFSPDSSTLAISQYTGQPNGMFAAGDVQIFTVNAGIWSFSQDLTSNSIAVSNYFGSDVKFSPDGTILAISERNGDPATVADAGVVHLFMKVAGKWAPSSTLISPNPVANGEFGGNKHNIAFDANSQTLAIGDANAEPNGVLAAGSVYLYSRSGSTWNWTTSIVSPSYIIGAYFGSTISFNPAGNRILIGKFQGDPDNYNNGILLVYSKTGTSWNHSLTIGSQTALRGMYFGYQITFSPDGSTFFSTDSSAKINGVDAGNLSVFQTSVLP